MLGTAYLTMAILLPSGEFQYAFDMFKSENVVSESALSQCNRAGQEFLLEDKNNVVYKCEFFPEEKSL